MFGFIYTLITSIGAVLHVSNEYKENEENKKKYEHPDGLTYVDIKGRSRLLSNDELVFYIHDKNGDYVLENVSGHVYKNFSKEKKEKEKTKRYIDAAEKHETTYCIDDDKHEKDFYCKGKRFKDFKTGDIYVIRYINYTYWYLNIADGMIVRKTDWQKKHDKAMKDAKTYLDKNLDIEKFNKQQKIITDKHMLYRNFNYNANCNVYK